MRAFVFSAAAALCLVVGVASPSHAQGFGIHVGPGGGGVYVNPGHRDRYDDWDNWRVTRREAIRIARRNGMEDIFDVDRTRHHWIVRGRNWKGRRVSMRIDRHGGWGWH